MSQSSARAEAFPPVRRAPRSVAWVLLLVSAAAVLVTGLIGTVVVLNRVEPLSTTAALPTFWMGLVVACGMTVASLGLRALRWVFLLRRCETRIPIRDAYIGYLSGFSLLLAPFLIGEIAVRAYVHRARGRVPIAVPAVLTIWERWLDALALAAIVGALALFSHRSGPWTLVLLISVAMAMLPPVRRACLRVAAAVVAPIARLAGERELPRLGRLVSTRDWAVAFIASVVAWLLPGVGFWCLAATWGHRYSVTQAEMAFASSALAGGLVLAPGGVVVAGGQLLADLSAAAFPEQAAMFSVIGIRLATAGLSTVLGALFLLLHFRDRPATSRHFDEIADAYDVQIPLARRQALLTTKTELMRQQIATHGGGHRGLDVGCGQGWYVARMRELGFDVGGIDASVGQVQLGLKNLETVHHQGASDLVQVGSVLEIPSPDGTYDFVYTINVLHHLSSVAEQRAAFAELIRVLKPGGLLFVHEINTRNVLFRFYMGYVFPSLNCIDEGVERWLLPHRLDRYTDASVVDIRYFTFLPEFAPRPFVRLLAPIEKALESSPLAIYSAHYMATLRKPG
jgi:ubiquinone/menaquinone biosynthesis C-methylase UbiE/uncharacterized membrane protein YbhN (UPF0104 family)